jgi:hypothetical protein
VSDLPVYVEGSFNIVSPKVALVAGDSVTFLSNAWQDSRSGLAKTQRVADNTTYNLTVMAGGLATVPHQVNNNGIASVLRVIESWAGRSFTLSGSVLCLWESVLSTAPHNTQFYDNPAMSLSYDSQYLSMSPPGVPHGFVYDEISSSEIDYHSYAW